VLSPHTLPQTESRRPAHGARTAGSAPQTLYRLPLLRRERLKIRTKDLQVVPFKINTAQRQLLEAIRRQEAAIGRCRVIILKARQMGLSTVVGGRMFWRASQNQNRKALVVTHKAESTRALFDMTRRYYDQCPEALKPSTRYSSRKELVFDLLDSGYMVATAGGDGIARGETITDAHLSELAFWPKDVGRAIDRLQRGRPDAEWDGQPRRSRTTSAAGRSRNSAHEFMSWHRFSNRSPRR
jgi:hypothetical protein